MKNALIAILALLSLSVSTSAWAGPLVGGGGVVFEKTYAECAGHLHDGAKVKLRLYAMLMPDQFYASLSVHSGRVASDDTLRCVNQADVWTCQSMDGAASGWQVQAHGGRARLSEPATPDARERLGQLKCRLYP